MQLRLAQLKVDSAKYLKERSAKNDRRAIVGEINAFVKTEMEVIDEHLGAHPERGYDEPQADHAAQVSQPDAAPHADVL